MRSRRLSTLILLLALAAGCDRPWSVPQAAEYEAEQQKFYLTKRSDGVIRTRVWNRKGEVVYEIIRDTRKHLTQRRSYEDNKLMMEVKKNLTTGFEVRKYYEDGRVTSKKILKNGKLIKYIMDGEVVYPDPNPSPHALTRKTDVDKDSITITTYEGEKLRLVSTLDLKTGIKRQTAYNLKGQIILKIAEKNGKVLSYKKYAEDPTFDKRLLDDNRAMEIEIEFKEKREKERESPPLTN